MGAGHRQLDIGRILPIAPVAARERQQKACDAPSCAVALAADEHKVARGTLILLNAWRCMRRTLSSRISRGTVRWRRLSWKMRAAIAPGVMVPELTAAWQLNAQGLDSLLGFYFLTHASFALVAGASLDRYGAKWTIPAGIACIAVGTTMFGGGRCSSRGNRLAFAGRGLSRAQNASHHYRRTSERLTRGLGGHL